MQANEIPAGTVTIENRPNDSTDIRKRSPHTLAGYRILVVDDNIINCQVAMQVLRKLGPHAEAVTTVRNAIDMHTRQPYDLILMDCQMPGLDGYQGTALIRETDGSARHTPIIGWTSTSGADMRTKCVEAGMDDMMSKPIGRDTAQELITRWAAPGFSLQLPTVEIIENDLAGTQQRFGANFAELAALYRTDTPKRIDAMRKAEADGDLTRIAAIAHVLSGSCASIGALHLASMCRDLEHYCKAAKMENLTGLLNEIQDEYSKTSSNIETLLQSATL